MTTLSLLLPETLVVVAGVICLFERRVALLRRPAWLTVALAGLLVAAALGVELTAGAQLRTLFQGGFAQDRFALFAKAALLLTTLVVVLASPWADLGRASLGFTLLACFGGMVSASATDLAGLWVGLELAVLASVAAISAREPLAARRALLLGGSLAALAALGMALVAAAAGTSDLVALRSSLAPPLVLPLALAVLLVFAALLGQLAAAPSSAALAIGAAGLMAAGCARAETLPRAGPPDPRIRTAAYSPDQVYRLYGFVGFHIDLEFEPGETFEALSGGDLEGLTCGWLREANRGGVQEIAAR